MSKFSEIASVTALAFVMTLFSGFYDSAEADEIVVPLTGSYSGLGTRGVYWYRGQTFPGPGGLAEQLTVYLDSVDLGKAKVRILLTDVDTSSGIHPTNVLFESDVLAVPFQFPPKPLTVDLSGIPLVSGQTYAWIIDAFADYDPLNTWSAETGMDNNGTYLEGDFIQLVGPGAGPPAGDRSNHFAMHWGGSFPIRDMAFRLIYTPLAAQEVAVDIRPQGCPNPLAIPNNGYLPIAIAGTHDLDVYQIDQASIRLEGVPPRRSSFEDVTTPYEPVTGKYYALDCNDYGPDGFYDLTVKFDADAVIAALGNDVEHGEVRVLTLTGNLLPEFGGDEILGEDVVVIKKPSRQND